MSGYLIVELEITDAAKFERYRELVPAIIEKYGGRYLVRGGNLETLEGDWSPKRIVVLEFESTQKAKQFLDSEEYAPVKQMRLDSANTNMIIAEGV